MTACVWIPTIAESGQDGQLLAARIAALSPDTVDLALKKNVTPLLYHLLEAHLYKQGYTVLEALRVLQRQGLVSGFSEKIELHCPVLLGTVDGQSMQLGFALSLLSSRFKSKTGLIASGCLVTVADEVLVRPVAGLAEKMALVLAEKHQGQWARQRCVFFVPSHYLARLGVDNEGAPLYAERPVSDLQPLIAELAAASIEVVALAKFGEVFNYLQPLPRPLGRQFCSGLSALAVIALGGWFFLSEPTTAREAPVALSLAGYRQQLENYLSLAKAQVTGQADTGSKQVLQQQIDALTLRLADIEHAYHAEQVSLSERMLEIEANNALSNKTLVAQSRQALARGDRDAAIAALETLYQTSATALTQAAAAKYTQGLLAFDQYNYSQALLYFQRALQLAPEQPEYVLALAKVALVAADYPQVLTLLTPLAGADKLPVEMRRSTLNFMGLAWDGLGEYDKAIAVYEQVLASDRQQSGKRSAQLAGDYMYLGESWRGKGAYAQAIAYFEKALALGPDDKDLSTVYNNLAAAYDNQNQFAKAERFYQQALAVDSRSYGEQHPYIARDLNNLGVVLCHQQACAQGMALFQRALAMNRRLYGAAHPSVASTFNNMGEALKNLGQYREAISYFQQALAIALALPAINQADLAGMYNNLGGAWAAVGEFTEADAAYRPALQLLLALYGEQHPLVKQTQANLHTLQQAQQIKKLSVQWPGS